MNTEQYSHPDSLERYAFLWSEARLVIAATALFLGGVPVLRVLVPVPALSWVVSILLTVMWIISGAAAAYLLYRWYGNKYMIFGGTDMYDKAAFLVSSVSGINLGIVGVIGTNIGMSVSSNRTVFLAVALIYVMSAAYLLQRWTTSGKKVF